MLVAGEYDYRGKYQKCMFHIETVIEHSQSLVLAQNDIFGGLY